MFYRSGFLIFFIFLHGILPSANAQESYSKKRSYPFKITNNGKGNVMAFQAIINHNQGDLRWRQMAAIGRFSMMQGYYLGRHREKNNAALHAEYRLHIWKFFGATGEEVPQVRRLSLNELRYAGGAGLRFQVDQKERVKIRFDVGFGSGTPGYYLTVGEAF